MRPGGSAGTVHCRFERDCRMNISGSIDAELLERVLAPFDGAPGGEDLRLDPSPNALYSALRDARSEARAAERLADNDPTASIGYPDWNTVERLSIQALASRSKDIEITAWLVESLTRSRGLDGLAEGAEILAGLIARFWDKGMFPAPDDEDPAYRLAAITGLSGGSRDGTLLQPLRRITLFEQEDGNPVTLWQYNRSWNHASLGKKDEASGSKPTAAPSRPVVPLDSIENSARSLGRPRLLATRTAALRAIGAWNALERAVADVVTPDAVPSTSRVLELLNGIVAITNRYLPADPDPEPPDAAVGDDEDGAPLDGPARASAGRDALLDDVLRIAGIFRIREPTSPLSYTLENAVRRARLSWPELLAEVMPDNNARTSVLTGLGIRPAQD